MTRGLMMFPTVTGEKSNMIDKIDNILSVVEVIQKIGIGIGILMLMLFAFCAVSDAFEKRKEKKSIKAIGDTAEDFEHLEGKSVH